MVDFSRRGFLKQLVALSAMAPAGVLSQGCRREGDAVVPAGHPSSSSTTA